MLEITGYVTGLTEKSSFFLKPLQAYKKSLPLRRFRVLSSAGSEHLPYKQRVTGSNPVAPTTEKSGYFSFRSNRFF
jgi:hypothetical protein